MRRVIVAVAVAVASGVVLFGVGAFYYWDQVRDCIDPRQLVAFPCDVMLYNIDPHLTASGYLTNAVEGWAVVSVLAAAALGLALWAILGLWAIVGPHGTMKRARS